MLDANIWADLEITITALEDHFHNTMFRKILHKDFWKNWTIRILMQRTESTVFHSNAHFLLLCFGLNLDGGTQNYSGWGFHILQLSELKQHSTFFGVLGRSTLWGKEHKLTILLLKNSPQLCTDWKSTFFQLNFRLEVTCFRLKFEWRKSNYWWLRKERLQIGWNKKKQFFGNFGLSSMWNMDPERRIF